MSTFQERFHKTMLEGFRERGHHYDETTDLYTLGDASTVDDFFDYLEFEFSGDLPEDERPHIRTVGQAWAWAWAAFEAELAEEDLEEEEKIEAVEASLSSSSPFAWRDRILPIQQLILRASYFLGLGMFGYGMYLTVKVKNTKLGNLLTGLGMFIAVQMFWGMQKFFNFLEQRDSSLLKKLGYPTMFWLAVGFTLLLDFFLAGLAYEFVLGG